MTGLQLFWFIIVGVLFSGFFFLEGFDYGVGMSAITIAKDKREVEQAIGSIGPVWDLNEVWLLTAGGAMFASFPYWYASLFSGFYLILFLILVGLIFRGVTFEFRHHSHTEKGKMLWTKVLGVASFAIPFLFGLMFREFVWQTWLSSMAANKLLAAPIACISPVKCRLISSIGTTWA